MLIAIIGENCVGKSTLAAGLNETLQGKIYSGKDYLRLEKNPAMAESAFKTLLKDAVSGENILYLITEKDHLSLLPDGAFRIVLTAELDTIKARFRERMHGYLPPPVEKMLEAKHGMYDNLPCQMKLNAAYDLHDVIDKLNLA
ncbi:MAG: hypothetical protein IJO67_09400 [Clostridia bacterium]|nr:hypothetical protein [Clostridia bacterium]